MAQVLSDAQQEALRAFVEAHEQMGPGQEKLRRARMDALRAAREAGVFGTTLAQSIGVVNARIYQLLDELERENPS